MSVFKKAGGLMRRFNGAVARCECPDCATDIDVDCECASCWNLTGYHCGLWLGANVPPDDPHYLFITYSSIGYFVFTSGTYPHDNGCSKDHYPALVYDRTGGISPIPCGVSTKRLAVEPVVKGELVVGDTEFVVRARMRLNGLGNCQWKLKLISLPSLTTVIAWSDDDPTQACGNTSSPYATFSGTIAGKAFVLWFISGI